MFGLRRGSGDMDRSRWSVRGSRCCGSSPCRIVNVDDDDGMFVSVPSRGCSVLASNSDCSWSAVVRMVSRVVRVSFGSRLWANVHFGLSQIPVRQFLHVVGPDMIFGIEVPNSGAISRRSCVCECAS